VTILFPVRDRVASARLWATVLPAPFTPAGAVVARASDLLWSGVDIIDVDLSDWNRADAVALVRVLVGLTRRPEVFVAVDSDASLAEEAGVEVLLLAPAQTTSGLPGWLPARGALVRRVTDPGAVQTAMRERGIDAVIVPGDPRSVGAAEADDRRAWFADLGAGWTDPAVLPQVACRLHIDVAVPADSPEKPVTRLREDVAALVARQHALRGIGAFGEAARAIRPWVRAVTGAFERVVEAARGFVR